MSSSSGSCRLANKELHIVCLGSGRLSTGVTIHQVPIGNLTVGSDESCDIILNGTGILSHHCCITRSDSSEVSVTPLSNDARVLVDGVTVTDEFHLQQGSMLTLGESNFLRFNNPTKAEMLKKTALDAIDHGEYSEMINGKNGNEEKFTKSFEISSLNFTENSLSNKNMNNQEVTKKMQNLKLKTNDFYPKVGNLKIYPISPQATGGNLNSFNNFNNSNSSNILLNNSTHSHQDPEKARKNSAEEEMRSLEEILQTCLDYEQKNSLPSGYSVVSAANGGSNSNVSSNGSANGTMERNKTSPQPYQNRIKTNGSLPKNFHIKDNNYFFNNLSDTSPVGNGQNGQYTHNFHNYSGLSNNSEPSSAESKDSNLNDEPKKYHSPQSPRTRIKTFISPPSHAKITPPPVPARPVIQQQPINGNNYANKNGMNGTNGMTESIKNDYEMLIKTFEDKFRAEIFSLQNYGENGDFPPQTPTKDKRHEIMPEFERFNGDYSKTDDETDEVLEKTVSDLKNEKFETLDKIRELKLEISDLQRQENEIFQESDMEKSLVTAEMSDEAKNLLELEEKLLELKQKMKRMEMQRKMNQATQEVQHNKLKGSIESKQKEIESLKQIIKRKSKDHEAVAALQEKLENTQDALENDKKTYEDIEFHYLEEETEWFSFSEDFNTNIKSFTFMITEKRSTIQHLEQTKIKNENLTLEEQRSLEHKLFQLKKNLEIYREKLKKIDKKLLNNENTYDKQLLDDEDDEDEDDELDGSYVNGNMSNSMFCDTNDLLTNTMPIPTSKDRQANLMSKSFNENMFFSNKNIETPSFNILDSIFMDENSKSPKNNSSVTSTSTPNKKFEKSFNLNFSFEEDLLKKETSSEILTRTPSQDELDRISKVTESAPIATKQVANYKTQRSIETIEQNRKFFLATQATSVIDSERQRMEVLKKRSSELAKAEYFSQNQPQEEKKGEVKNKFAEPVIEGDVEQKAPALPAKKPSYSSQHRHSNPEFYDQKNQKMTKAEKEDESEGQTLEQKHSTSTIELKNNSFSLASTTVDPNCEINEANMNEGILQAGAKRNTPKHQRPLTRYLPILSADLNLKQHIETAGHQLQLCPHVIINETSCRGYLNKLGAKFGQWSKRWFVFDRDQNVLLYYSDKSEKKPRGGAYFTTINEVYLDHSSTSKNGRTNFCTFVVKTKKRSYHLQAPSSASARIWIDVIITGAQGSFFDY